MNIRNLLPSFGRNSSGSNSSSNSRVRRNTARQINAIFAEPHEQAILEQINSFFDNTPNLTRVQWTAVQGQGRFQVLTSEQQNYCNQRADVIIAANELAAQNYTAHRTAPTGNRQRKGHMFVLPGNTAYNLHVESEVHPASAAHGTLVSIVRQTHPVNNEIRYALVTTTNAGTATQTIIVDANIGYVINMKLLPDMTPGVNRSQGFVGRIAIQREVNGNWEYIEYAAPAAVAAPTPAPAPVPPPAPAPVATPAIITHTTNNANITVAETARVTQEADTVSQNTTTAGTPACLNVVARLNVANREAKSAAIALRAAINTLTTSQTAQAADDLLAAIADTEAKTQALRDLIQSSNEAVDAANAAIDTTTAANETEQAVNEVDVLMPTVMLFTTPDAQNIRTNMESIITISRLAITNARNAINDANTIGTVVSTDAATAAAEYARQATAGLRAALTQANNFIAGLTPAPAAVAAPTPAPAPVPAPTAPIPATAPRATGGEVLPEGRFMAGTLTERFEAMEESFDAINGELSTIKNSLKDAKAEKDLTQKRILLRALLVKKIPIPGKRSKKKGRPLNRVYTKANIISRYIGQLEQELTDDVTADRRLLSRASRMVIALNTTKETVNSMRDEIRALIADIDEKLGSTIRPAVAPVVAPSVAPVSFEKAINDTSKYKVNVSFRSGYKWDENDSSGYSIENIASGDIIKAETREDLVKNWDDKMRKLVPKPGYKFVENPDTTGNYATVERFSLPKGAKEISGAKEVKAELDHLLKEYEIGIGKKTRLSMHAAKTTGFPINGGHLDNFKGEATTLDSIFADETNAYAFIVFPKTVGETKEERKEWLKKNATMTYDEHSKNWILNIPLFLQAGFYSPDTKSFGLTSLWQEENAAKAKAAIGQLAVVIDERDTKLKKFKKGNQAVRTLPGGAIEEVVVERVSKGVITFKGASGVVQVPVGDIGKENPVLGTFEKPLEELKLIHAEYNKKIQNIGEL